MWVRAHLRKKADNQTQLRDINAAMLLNCLLGNLKLILAGAVSMAVGLFLIGLLLFSYTRFMHFEVIIRAASLSFAGFIVGFVLFASLIVLREFRYGLVYLPSYEKLHPAENNELSNAAVTKAHDTQNLSEKSEAETKQMSAQSAATKADVRVIAELADNIIATANSRNVFISPEGQIASKNLVNLVRLIATQNRRVLFIEISGSDFYAKSILKTMDKLGVTDLLIGRCPFEEAYHQDVQSPVMMMPFGLSDPEMAMHNVTQLREILDFANTQFDVVLINCGHILAADLAPIMSEPTKIIFLVRDNANENVMRAKAEYAASGYQNIIIFYDDTDIPAVD